MSAYLENIADEVSMLYMVAFVLCLIGIGFWILILIPMGIAVAGIGFAYMKSEEDWVDWVSEQ